MEKADSRRGGKAGMEWGGISESIRSLEKGWKKSKI
jgi:hypothetical protein